MQHRCENETSKFVIKYIDKDQTCMLKEHHNLFTKVISPLPTCMTPNSHVAKFNLKYSKLL